MQEELLVMDEHTALRIAEALEVIARELQIISSKN